MAQDEKSGRILAGRYRLRRPIGSGAHGTVYCAEDLGRSGRHVAFKLAEELVGGSRGGEAEEILRRFQHPNWATVLDAGKLDEQGTFQVTRLVPGRSLDHVDGQQPIEWVWRLLEDGARVLGALHRHGLIHYDVTPGNLILNAESGGPRFVLTDGGLAHLGPVEGVARGTPLYMAPEVTEEGGHDHRADLYSLGLVAYRLATGRDPIEGGAGEILRKRREEDAPRASTLRDDVPSELDTLLADLLSRDPRQRPHDAFALLERLDSAQERDVPAFLHEEGLAAAEGGPIFGRNDQLERFDETLTALRERRSAGGRRLAQARAKTPRDSVLLLRGLPGCGASRLAEEMTAHARQADVPCLLIAGRDQAGDRRGPLRHLTDGLVTLGVASDVRAPELRLDLGTGRSVGRAERAHAGTRAVEQFLRAIEQAAARTPYVLVVQDFQDLPSNAQEALRVLSRHLLARRESGGSPQSLALLLVVDLGSTEPDSFLLPDAREPREPVLELNGEDAATIEQICGDRFPGFAADDSDLDRVVEAAEGLPGVLASLLGEACRRGDLAAESGRWHWNVNRIDEYDVQRGVSPAQADALRNANEDQLRLLAQLSLVDTPLSETLVSGLWDDQVPASQLVQSSSRDGGTYLSPLNLAVRTAVTSRLRETETRRLQQQLLDALNTQDDAEAAVDRARLAVELGEQVMAVAVLHEHWARMPVDSRAAVQKLIRRAAETNTVLLESAERRAHVAEMLEYDPAATSVAKLIAARLPEADELQTAEAVAATLRSAREYAEALAVLQRAHPADLGEDPTDARLWTSKAFLQFELHQADAARDCVSRARACLRRVPNRRAKHPRLLAEFLMAESQARFHSEESTRAIWALRAAHLAAKRTRSPVLRAKIINNMGIVENQCGRTQRSIACLERALRLKRVLGDVRGAVKTTLNLGRLRQEEGALVKSAALYQAAASSARRHAQPVALSRALLLLAQVYDQQLNTRLAATTLERAVRVAELADLPIELARAVWDLAPIMAAIGDARSADEMLLRSALAARRDVTSYSRAAHHLASALTALHLGVPRRAALEAERSYRHRSTLYPDMRRLLDTVVLILRVGDAVTDIAVEDEPERPSLSSQDRYLWRSRVWFRRVARASSHYLPPMMGWGTRAKSGHMPIPGNERRLVTEMLLRASLSHEHTDRDALLLADSSNDWPTLAKGTCRRGLWLSDRPCMRVETLAHARSTTPARCSSLTPIHLRGTSTVRQCRLSMAELTRPTGTQLAPRRCVRSHQTRTSTHWRTDCSSNLDIRRRLTTASQPRFAACSRRPGG